MNSRTCRSCGAEMSQDDAFCPECGTHVVDQALIPGDEAVGPGGAPPRRPRRGVSQPSDTAYERLEPPEPDATYQPSTDEDDIQPIRRFDEPAEVDETEDEYAGYPETPSRSVSPVMLGLAAVFVAIIIAGIIVAVAGGSDDGGTGTDTVVGGSGLRGGSPGGFGSMLPDGTLSCTKAPASTATGPRTAIAGVVETLAPPATWSSRDVVKGRLQGTGAGVELTLNPGDHDRAVPQSARISILSVETNVSYFPDQFLIASLPPGNATTTQQDCVDYGPYTALRIYRIELKSGATLTTRYVVLHDKLRRGSATLFVFEDPRASSADAAFFESLVASAKLLK